MRSIVDSVVEELIARNRAARVDGGEREAHSGGSIHLNDIDEVIGYRAVSYEDVEAIIERLEAAGFAVGEPLEHHEVEVMQAVLASARRLRAVLGRVPKIEEISASSGYAPHLVRRALEHGKSIWRAP